MRVAVMTAPGEVRVEDRPDPTDHRADGCDHPAVRDLCLRLGPVALPGHRSARRAAADGPRVRRHRRRSRFRGHHGPARAVRGRLVLRLRQHLRDLPLRLPVLLRPAGGRPPRAAAQADRMRVPLADGTLVATPEVPSDDLVPSLLAASDVLGTGWFGAVAAEAGPGKTVAVVGDGAVGLLGVLAAKQLGAERIIAMSRHEPRQKLALDYGATDIVTERGDDGVARIKDLTGGLGAHSVIEAVGTQESMMQAIRATRPGGHMGFVGVNHDVQLPGDELFFSHAHVHGGPAPVRRFLPDLIERIWTRQIDPGKVFDLELPLQEAAEGYRAMDSRQAIKVLLRP